MDPFSEAGVFLTLSHGIGPLGPVARFRRAALQCLHNVSCQMCNPPPEVSDSFRLGLAVFFFGFTAAALAAACPGERLGPWVIAYCCLGLTRVLPHRRLLFVSACGFAALEWGVVHQSPEPVAFYGPVVILSLSELLWLRTMQKALDLWFDAFVTIVFVFLGSLMVFGFYPAMMRFGPYLLEPQRVHDAMHSVVSDAAEDSGAVAGIALTGTGVMSQDPEHSGRMALSQLLPLLIFVIGAPALAMVILIYWWMFEHMTRMILGVVITFVAWIAIYGFLQLLHVPISRDFVGKALLASVCVVMYYAFARMTSLDWYLARRRVALVSASFCLLLLLDALVGGGEGYTSPEVLFAVLLGCKLAYASVENAVESGHTELNFRHILPLLPIPKESEAAVVASRAEGLSEAPAEDGSYEMLESSRQHSAGVS